MAVFFVKVMNKDKILELLKSIQYPGFSRDIVSFGMVRDIIIDNDSISVILNIKTQQEDKCISKDNYEYKCEYKYKDKGAYKYKDKYKHKDKYKSNGCKC